MVTTRSMTSALDEEERRRFLAEGAEAAQRRALAEAQQGAPPQAEPEAEAAGGAPAGAQPAPPQPGPPRPEPGAIERPKSAEPGGARRRTLINQQGMEFSPRSPNVDLQTLWRERRRRPLQIPLDAAGTTHFDWTTDKAVTFADPQNRERRVPREDTRAPPPAGARERDARPEPQNLADARRRDARPEPPNLAGVREYDARRQSSNLPVSDRDGRRNAYSAGLETEARHETYSNISFVSSTAARLHEAELEAAEQLAKIEEKRLRMEADLIKKRLVATQSRIQLEGSRAGSLRDDTSHQGAVGRERVEHWLDTSGEPARDNQCKKRRREEDPLREPEVMEETPHRPAPQSEPRRTRFRSLSRERPRQRSQTPTAPMEEPRTPRTGHTYESAVTEGMLNLFEKMQMAARPAPKDIYELPHFNGDVSEWRSFFNTYSETTKRYGFTDYENVARLRMALRGDAKACVQHVLSTATKPEMIIKILKKQFGRSEVLLDRAIEDLRRLPPLGSSAQDLNAFAIKIMNIVSTIMDLDRRHYADNPMLIREVTDRLSPHLRSRWCDYARNHRDSAEPEIVQLADFLMDESDQEMAFCHARAAPRRPQAASTAAPPAARGFGSARQNSAAPRAPATTAAPWRTNAPRPAYTTQEMRTCMFCGGQHATAECRKLGAQSLGARWEWAKLNRICFKCLDAKHRRSECRARGCGVVGCPHSHHKLLHQDATVPVASPAPNQNQGARMAAPLRATTAATSAARSRSQPPQPSQPARQPTHNDADGRAYTTASSHEVLLKVLPVTITGPGGTAHIYAMLDDGSTLSILEEDIAEQIGATGPDAPLCVRGIGSSVIRSMTQVIEATVRPMRGGDSHIMKLRTVNGLGLRTQTLHKERLLSYPHLSDLEAEIYTTGVPQMLIGLDHWHLMVASELRTGGRNEPCAIKTPLGWAFYGIMPRAIPQEPEVGSYCYHAEADVELNELVKKHWSIEALGVRNEDNVSPADERAVKLFNETVKKVGDRYEVGQLWKQDDVVLPPSYNTACNRYKNLESRMRRDEAFEAEYRKQIDTLIEKGYAERVVEPPRSDKTWFLPHFSVYNANKNKHRAVFDCAAKSQGLCLNDFILSGPDLLKNLVGVLLRFREWGYAVVADIQEMFLRIQIAKRDQASQLFLWRTNRHDDKPQIYKLNRVCFGSVSSPFLAHAVRNRNAEDNADRYPRAVAEIKNNHYMDDYVASYQTEEDLHECVRQVSGAHAEGGFHLRGYASNSEPLLASIEPQLRAQGPSTLLGEKEQTVLGMTWEPATDTLGYNTKLLRVPKEVKELRRPPTKRELLSTIMSIYDPLGLISHYVIAAKIIFQRVWATGASWDEPIAEKEADDFALWLRALDGVATLRVPRQINMPAASCCFQLHIFTDASPEAYCAVAYWRIQGPDGVAVSLAAGKARVCPLKVLSVPRLELQAAVIGTRLAENIRREQRYPLDSTIYWSDSQVLIGWIKDDARQYKPFVSHRLAEIVERSDREAWRYVPTDLNPADRATRCKPNTKITIEDSWYQGPQFLRLPEEEWPPSCDVSTDLPERRQQIHATYEKDDPNPEAVLPDITRFSNYDRLLRSTANVLLFIEKLKTKNRSLQLQVRHLRQAEHYWIQCSQRRSFPDELRTLHRGEPITKQSRLYRLAPTLSDDGVLRMRTRTTKAPLLYAIPQPIILDGREAFTKLYIEKTHRKASHIHNEAVINELRTKFWILHLRPTVKKIAHDCQICVIRRAKPRTQPLGDLPPERLQAYQRPFTFSAQDYMGPMFVTIGRRREKRWVCLYTCLSTRAIHLETVNSLSSDSAILALRRFAARRGWPRVMYSDNATCFRAAAVELREAVKQWLPELQSHGLQHYMEWKFIPPGNPSAGGAWERMVRTVKTALSVTLHERAPREETFNTLLAEVENIVNRRPLTSVNVEDADVEESLTPAHFLLLQNANLPLLGRCEEADRKQWRATQALADHFWRRWVAEYFPLLAPRQSSYDGGRQIQPGDVVVIAEPDGPRSLWPRGVVEATYPGPDGRARVAAVRTKHGVLRRPTCRLAVIVSLPMQQKSSGEDCGDSVGDTPDRRDTAHNV